MKFKLIFCAIVFQILSILAMLGYAYAPIYFGKKIVIDTSLYDPRDLFRGNYVHLSYNFSTYYDDENLSESQNENRIYAVLKLDKDDFYKFDKLTYKKPDSGVFIAGRIDSYGDAKYGIEAFFMPKQKAQQMEIDMRKFKARAVIYVMSNGKARISDLILIKKNQDELEKEFSDIVKQEDMNNSTF